MKLRAFVIFICLILCSVFRASAQGFEANGVVLDKDGLSVIGATVMVDGTSNGTITDMDGKFFINVPNEKTMLKISYIGYESVTIAAAKNMKIVLSSEAQELEEVVVVGYGVVKKSDLTSSIATLKEEDIKKNVGANFVSAMQGKVAGVQITNSSGAPGSTPNVIIRGVTTQNGSSPLYVVDGIPGVNINSINQNDIKSIEILKDAASTSIYGARGSNGIILITTKKGAANTKTQFNLSMRTGIQTIPNPGVASAEEYQRVYEARYLNDNLTVPVGWDGTTSTDWWNELVRDFAPIQDYNLSFNGGTEKLIYSGSIGYFRQESQVKDKGYWDRLTARFNTEYRFNKKFKLTQDFAPSYRSSESYYTSAMGSAMQYDPTTPVYRPADEQAGLDEFSIFAQSRKTTTWNPVAAQYRTFGSNKWFAILSNTSLEYQPIKNLFIRSVFGIDALFGFSNSFQPSFNIGGTEKLDVNKVTSGTSNNFNWVWNNTVTYLFSVGKHNFNVMGGFVMEKYNSWSLNGSAEGVPNNYNEALRYLDAATSNYMASGINSYSSLESFLGRFQYNYDRKYYLTATYRVDGSSKFMKNNKYAHFPSISVAYNMKNEEWLQDVEPLSALRFHGGWGIVGNQNIPAGAYENKIGTVQTVLGNKVVNGSTPTAVANQNIKWEVVEDYNIGVEVGLFSMLNLSFEYFNKTSHDMLMQAKNPLISGYPMGDAKMWTNIGSMRAKGYEVSLNIKDYSKAFTYDINFNFSKIKNTAIKLIGNEPQYNGSFLNQTTHKTEVGGEIGRFFLYETDGLFQNQEEINSHTDEHGNLIQPNAKPGDIRFVDQNGDGVLDESDKIYAGSGLPKYTVGLNASFAYKNFDLSFNMVGNFGNKIFNSQKQRLDSGYAGVNVRAGLWDDVWREDNPSGTVPRLSVNDANGNFTTPSTYFLESGNYVRMQNLQLGYNFAIDAVKFRVYLSAQNVFTITKYSGMDPEAPVGTDVLASGIDWFPYAQPKMYFIGLNVNF